jgi:hypothetical protein
MDAARRPTRIRPAKWIGKFVDVKGAVENTRPILVGVEVGGRAT